MQDFPFLVECNDRYDTIEPRVYGPEAYDGFPARVSIPVPPGACRPKDAMALQGPDGQAVPAQLRPLLCWPDGSARVWELWFPCALRRMGRGVYTLHPGAPGGAPPADTLPEPSRVVLTVVLGDGMRLRQEVALPPLPAGDGLSAWRDEIECALARAGEFPAFRGAVVRRAWSWFPGMELSLRLIQASPFEVLEVREVRLDFDLPGRGTPRYAAWQAAVTACTPRLVEASAPFMVRADGCVHVTDLAQFGMTQTDFPPYERGAYLEMTESWVGMADDDAAWVLAVPDAAERWPKGWSIQGRHVTVELHPAWAEPLRWRQGMALFQRLGLTRLPADSSARARQNAGMAWLRPPIVTVGEALYRAAGWRIPFRYQPERFPRTECTIRETWNFAWNRGTFDWGDDGFEKGRRNHEYDVIACAAKEFARTGHTELWTRCRAAAEHMMYTDFVAVSADPWKEGGVPAHCAGHTSGSAYPSHMWVEGLLLYYQLSGDPYALRVARRVGDFFLKYIAERFNIVASTGREMGWSLVALAALYDVTGDDRYLDGCRTIVDHFLPRGVASFFPTDATFCVGVALIGLDRVRPYYRGEEIARFIPAVLDWLMAHRCDGLGLFDYWLDRERKAFPSLQAHLPEALYQGYRLTGDLKYLKAAWRLFQLHMAGVPLTVQHKYGPPESGLAGGYHISWTMGCLHGFAEQGWLDKVQLVEV